MRSAQQVDDCVSESTLIDFFAGSLPTDKVAELERHFDRCPSCAALVLTAAPVLAGESQQPALPWGLPPELQPGRRLVDRYKIEALIGWGATGYVFRAFDELLGAVVAIKVLRAHCAAQPAWMERFTRELRVARALNHPHVCRIYDLVTADHPFLVMEAAERSLREELRAKLVAQRRLSERLKDAAQITAGLAAIHDAGILHRDVKPENVLRMADGRLVLSDFGLASLPTRAAPTLFVGTPQFMAPEVLAGKPATRASDMWSLGLVLYEIIFGRKAEWRTRGDRRVLKPRKLSGWRERAAAGLCHACLSANPADRPRSAGRLASNLIAIAEGRGLTFLGDVVSRRTALAVGVVAGAAATFFITRSKRAARLDRLEARIPGPRNPPTLWLGGASRASFASEGAIAVVHRSPQTGFDLVHTGQPQRKPLDDKGKDAVLSTADDRSIAFVREPFPDALRQEEIWLMDAFDGQPRALTAGGCPRWMGDTLRYHDRKRNVVCAIAAGEEGARPVDLYAEPPCWFPTFTADGKRMVSGGKDGPVMIELATRKQLFHWATPPRHGLLASLSPDERLLAFGGYRDDPFGLWVLDMRLLRVIRVRAGYATSPVWHPSETRLTFDDRTPDVPRSIWQIGTYDLLEATPQGLTHAEFLACVMQQRGPLRDPPPLKG